MIDTLTQCVETALSSSWIRQFTILFYFLLTQIFALFAREVFKPFSTLKILSQKHVFAVKGIMLVYNLHNLPHQNFC